MDTYEHWMMEKDARELALQGFEDYKEDIKQAWEAMSPMEKDLVHVEVMFIDSQYNLVALEVKLRPLFEPWHDNEEILF